MDAGRKNAKGYGQYCWHFLSTHLNPCQSQEVKNRMEAFLCSYESSLKFLYCRGEFFQLHIFVVKIRIIFQISTRTMDFKSIPPKKYLPCPPPSPPSHNCKINPLLQTLALYITLLKLINIAVIYLFLFVEQGWRQSTVKAIMVKISSICVSDHYYPYIQIQKQQCKYFQELSITINMSPLSLHFSKNRFDLYLLPITSMQTTSIHFEAVQLVMRKLRTEAGDDGHLTTQRLSDFHTLRPAHSLDSKGKIATIFPTNYSVTLKNAYSFILLHLVRSSSSKNKLGINIPEVCIFHSRVPFQLFYSEHGDIKSLHHGDRLTLREMQTFFKVRSSHCGTPASQLSVACFQGQQFFMMSEMDLFITSHKHRRDPFFSSLLYIRNRKELTTHIRRIHYNPSQDSIFSALATECFIGLKNDKEILVKYGQTDFLRFCNQKICLFLNCEQNIRISGGIFTYALGADEKYYLVDVSQLDFTNLTGAILARETRLKQVEENRSKILQMSEEKYQRYKSEQSKPSVKLMEAEMNGEMQKIAKGLGIYTAKREAEQSDKARKMMAKLVGERSNQDKPRKGLITQSRFMKKWLRYDQMALLTFSGPPEPRQKIRNSLLLQSASLKVRRR